MLKRGSFMRIKIALIIMSLLLLCGCGDDSVENSLRVPVLPAEFVEFNDEIDKIKNAGFELITPNGGTNRQSVQLADLDGDGVDEGIAFFRELGNSYKVYTYFFKKTDEGYGIEAMIEGSGDTVENVTYADLLGNGNNEVIIGWGMSESGAKSVGAYSVADGAATKLCEVASLYHIVYDLNYDMISDLCVVYEDPTDGAQKIALYSEYDGSVLFRASAPLSSKSDTILRIRASYVGDMQPAIFVEKRYHSAGVITDVIIWNKDFLKNITYSDTALESEKTARIYELYCEDVDADGTLEVPMPQLMNTVGQPVQGEPLQGTIWYGINGNAYERRAYTFRLAAEKWSMSLPLDWEGKCSAIYHKKATTNLTTFYSYRQDGVSEELFSIVAITGDNRESNMEKLGLHKLLDRNGTLYAVEIKKKRYLGYDITPEMLIERFSYRESEWSTGEVVF